MKINKSEKKIKIALLGLGLDNLALLKLLDKNRAPVVITICDFRQKNKLPKIEVKNITINYRLEQNFNKDLGDFKILFRSPGWPIACPGIQEALKNKKTKLTSALNLFFQLVPTNKIIGVTGTKGKGTTATLIYRILKAHLKKRNDQVFLGGNIGIPPLSFLEKVKKSDYVVLELSSFQLEDLEASPALAVITNLYKEHLSPADPNNPNFHPSYNAYWQAKLNIAKKNNKFLIINNLLVSKIKKEKISGKILPFTASDLPSKLTGAYNQENIAAAIMVAQILKIPEKTYAEVIANFKNLEHRLQLVSQKNGINFFDNSFSTTPESTILDLNSFSGNIIQIAGGADKGADFKKLAKKIKQRVKLLILLPGKGSDRIELELKKINLPTNNLFKAQNMAAAIKKAKSIAKAGDNVLLSTACASFGIFKNYKERGDQFKKYAQQK